MIISEIQNMYGRTEKNAPYFLQGAKTLCQWPHCVWAPSVRLTTKSFGQIIWKLKWRSEGKLLFFFFSFCKKCGVRISQSWRTPDSVAQDPAGCCMNEGFQAPHTALLFPKLSLLLANTQLAGAEVAAPSAICVSAQKKWNSPYSCSLQYFLPSTEDEDTRYSAKLKARSLMSSVVRVSTFRIHHT